MINPSKTKPKLSRTPKLLSSFVIASGLIGLMFFSLNVEAKTIRYECTDTNVFGLGECEQMFEISAEKIVG